MIYLDNAATTKISPGVLSAMMPYLQEEYGNAGTLYALGRRAHDAIGKARQQAAKLFGCEPDHVVFTSGGSEGNNAVFKGLRHKLEESGKKHLVISATEHDSVIRAAESLTKDGFYITYVYPGNSGFTADIVDEAIQPDTGLVSIMFANNETGAVNDIQAIGLLCKQNGVLFHTDCVQAAGQCSISVDANCIDFATISAHKIHGPKGVGALYIRDKDIMPLIHGGDEQEFGLRGGTENVAGIVGLGAACESAEEDMEQHVTYIDMLKGRFMIALARSMGQDFPGIYCNGESYAGHSKILSLTVDGVFGESLVLMMDSLGVCISAGSACRSHEAMPSRTLLAYGLTEEQARNTVRISFSGYNTTAEIDRAAAIMAECIETLRSPMPV